MLPERARQGQEGDPRAVPWVIPSRMLCWPQPLHTQHLCTHWGRVCTGLTRVGDTPGTAGKSCWHGWHTPLAQLAHVCAQCMLPARMTFTPRARFALPEHNPTHTCLGRSFLEHREAKEYPVPGVLMSHPTFHVTWMPCTWTLPRNPKCWPMGTPCSSSECHTHASWWGEDSSTPVPLWGPPWDATMRQEPALG